MPTGQSTLFNEALYFDWSNPFRYGGYIGQCTWYCWSKAKAKALAYPDRNINYADLPTSDAKDWLSDAQNNGYETGSTPQNDSIAVWGGNYGHVAFVETWDGTNVCYSEANIRPNGHAANAPNSIRVSADYFDAICGYVADVTEDLDITITVNNYGADGQFHTESQSEFEGSSILGYIYLRQST